MQTDNHQELPESLRRLRQTYRHPAAPEGYLDALADRVTKRTQVPARRRRLWPRLAAAAAVLLLVIAGWQLFDAPTVTTEGEIANQAVELSPADDYLTEIDEDFLLSVVLLEAEDLVLPEEYLLEAEDELYLFDLEL